MRARNEVKAGIVIFVALSMLVIGIFVVGDFASALRESRMVHVLFDDIGGLKTDDPVYACGVKVGRVKEVSFSASRSKEGKEHTKVLVAMSIRTDAVIREGYSVTVDKTLTAITSVVITPGSGAVVQSSPEKPLVGTSPSNISDIASKISDQATELGQVLLEKITVISEEVNGILSTMSALLNDVRGIVGDPSMRENIVATVERIRQSVEDIKGLTESAKAMVDENREAVRSAVENIRDSANTLNLTLSENREKLSSILTKLDKTSDTLDSTLAKLGEAGDKAAGLFDDNRENIQRMVESLKTTASTAKTTIEMIKRQPWRLLNKPERQELETTDLYDSAHQFNEGAAAVNEAAADLLLTMSRAGGQVDGTQLQRAIDKLDASLAKYDEAEKAFWRCLNDAYRPR
ncbi:MAG: MlaD family protein [Planctomycetota bacterium]|nr:MlaD family protein [Planctomycetota bacterium]